MTTSASLFTGGGLWDVGARMAGLTPVWGIEYRADIAAVARKNIPDFCVIVSDVASVIYSALQRVYHLHSSPSCKNASSANSKGEEATQDIESALAICVALRALEPMCFTLENVWLYRTFDSFKIILTTLHELGYCVKYWRLCAADYGVPQERYRLVLIARRDKEPIKPPATHYKTDAKKAVKGMRSLFWQPWRGWYEAIEDLIPALPETEPAPWQLARITVTTFTSGGGSMPRAFIVNGQNGSKGRIYRRDGEPMFTVTNQGNGKSRVVIGGRWVSITPRCLARFQSIPDEYELPERNSLAYEILGNAVPCLLAKAICESLI